ncbi:MAG: discoidin domain-containing protein [Clostridia bacterium]|nr:discoidin domain-containing protein [Clostridia bacterium]
MRSKRWIAAVACVSMMCTPIFGYAETKTEAARRVVVNLEFDSMVTNAAPFGVTVSKSQAYVRQPDEKVKNKVLEITEPARKSSVDISLTESADSMTFSFDYMQKDTQIARSISLVDANAVVSSLLSIDTQGQISVYGGKQLVNLQPETWYNFTLVCRLSEKRYDVYVNGSLKASMVLMEKSTSLNGAKLLRFSAGVGGVGSQYCLDNIRCCKGTSLPDESAFIHETFNEEWMEPITISMESDESTVYANLNFNQDVAGEKPTDVSLNTKSAVNIFEVREFPDEENKSLMISKGTGESVDPYGDISISSFAASSAVLEASFYPEDAGSVKIITFRDSNAKFNEVLRFTENGEIRICGKTAGNYTAGKWYDIALIMNYQTMTVDGYINQEKVCEGIPFANMNSEEPATMRIQIPASSAAGVTFIDNVRFYAGSERKTEEELSQTADGSSATRRLIADEDEVKALLQNAVAVQMYSGKASAGDEKTVLSKGATEINHKLYLPVRYVAEALNGTVTWTEENQAITVQLGEDVAVYPIDSLTMQLNGNEIAIEAAACIYEDTGMIPAEELQRLLPNLQISQNDKYGIVVLDKDNKNITAEQLKDIYDFTTYSRPAAEQILKDFQPMKNVHPRLMATAEDFEAIAQNLQTDANMQKWYASMIKSADNMLTLKHTYYYIPDGTRLLEMSRQLLNRARTLGMAYRLTKEQKYLDYLWGEMEAVCNFKDWNSTVHFLDTAEMTMGVAIAYDWCYDAWMPEQRKLMENAIMTMGLQQGEKCLDFKLNGGTQWQIVDNNWNQVCAGGMSVGALALMDLHPEYCSDMIARCLLALENSLGEYAPDGAWGEGPDYWAYALRYLIYHMASMKTTLGTDYGYLDGSYMRTTADYITYTQSSQGAFNLGDAASGIINEPTVFYLGKLFDMPELTKKRLQNMESYSKSGSAVDLLFYEPSHADADVELALDTKIRDIEVATFRSAWMDENAMFVGIHGGYNDVNHGNLDAGTFVLDAQGVRWADELGSDNYNQGDYFTRTNGVRYTLYRCSTQGQNVLALNPTAEFGQEQYATAKITEYVSKPRGGYAVVDMTPVYGNKVHTAKRGIKLDHERTQAVVQDEISLTYATDVWWFMHTTASVEISKNGKTAILTKNGKKMYATLDCNLKEAKFSVSAATPLANSGVKPSVNSLANYRRLQINLPKANGEITLAVRFIPISGNMIMNELAENGAGKTIPISRWNIEDGEIVVPTLDSITVNGEEVAGFAPDKTSYSIEFEFGNDKTPVLEAKAAEGFEAVIAQPEDANGLGEIKVYEKANPENVNYYSLSFRVLPLMGVPENRMKHSIKKVEVSSEPQAENPKGNAIDGDLSTRWSASGYTEWIQVDLGEIKPIEVVSLAFYSGTSRVTYFDMQLSQDGKNWTTVYSGESSGVTDGYESYFLGAQNARYIRMNSFGNSVNNWNSYSEIEVYGAVK